MNNREIRESQNIIKILTGSNSNKFRTCLKLYVLKLIYDYKENYYDYAQLNLNNQYGIGFMRDNDIEEIKGASDSDIIPNDMRGFEYYFLPISDAEEENDKSRYYNTFIDVFKGIKNIVNNDEKITNEDNELLKKIKTNDFDIFYCVLVNLCFSHYYDINFENFSNLFKWIQEKMFLEQKEDSKRDIFEIFINKNK